MASMEEQTAEKKEDLRQQIEKQLEAFPLVMDPTQVADVLGVTRRYVDTLIDKKQIESFVLDGTMLYKYKRITKAALIAFMIDR